MSSIVIRPARAADLDRITEIYADAVANGTASYEMEVPAVDTMTARYETVVAGNYPYLVAADAATVLGYAYASAFRPRPGYRFTVENSVYVAPEKKGQGIGKELMQALIVECERLGFRQILAVIGDGTPNNPSLRLHEKLGFQYVGNMQATGYKHGRWLDTVIMQMTLNGGNTRAPDPESLPERLFLEKATK